VKKNRYQAEPVLTIGEGEDIPGGSAYIRFAEYIKIPGLEKADISIEFKNKKRFVKSNNYEIFCEMLVSLLLCKYRLTG
jgi:hypothetical protein